MVARRGFKTKAKNFQARYEEEVQELRQKYSTIQCTKESIKRFDDFPLSKKTLNGLTDSKFDQPTDIQREAIGPALQGADVLGAAITGSGKTLAFLIPIIEHLYVNQWSRTDGIGAIVISPTRELAYQIFETLKKIGRHHDFSAGLIIGGKNLKFERRRMDQCNILICTPGRLLQHMDENPLFNATTIEMLVLDEADRCLDMGFEQTLNAIVENFPPERQTLLFSATQTNSVKDLARLNLKNPIYIGFKNEAGSTLTLSVPDLLQQNYVVIALEDKITMLWSFIKNHLKQKIIVFLSSCKQVKYIYEIFCKLRPGTSLLALYGTLHQDRRIAIYQDFINKSNVVLFATDIASRGLDFPSVNWVVQLDCPEDVTQYIHRAGRSARNKTRGESLLVLMPSEEEAMIEDLGNQTISLRKIQIDPKKLFSPRVKIEALLAQNSELKASAQRAFIAYIKSIFLMKKKNIFNVFKLDFDAYAKSLGLAVTPRVRFLERLTKKQNKSSIIDIESKESDDDSKRVGGMSHKSNFKLNENNTDSDSDSDDDFIKVKRIDHEIQIDNDAMNNNDDSNEEISLPLIMPKKEKVITKAALAKKALKKKLQVNDKRRFNEDGQEITDARKQMQSSLAKMYDKDNDNSGGIDIEIVKKIINEEDKYDKQRFRELVKLRHKKQKDKLNKKSENIDDDDDDDDRMDAQIASNSDTDDQSVDLSWLPHPDKVYGNPNESAKKYKSQDDSDNDSNDSDDDNDDSHSGEPLMKKPKVTSKLSLNDAEIIAAQLLANVN